jgi:curved DNA-binding protein CbpA
MVNKQQLLSSYAMHLKDYYKILELESSATSTEIKQAYRRLALLHHPDKNNNDPYSASLFAEIKEAYEVLTNPSKKEQYLQQRWYNQSIGKKKTATVTTPVSVLKDALELERYVSKLDIYRMDKQGLFEYINAQLDDNTIEKLNDFKEQDVNDQIIYITLKSVKPLTAEQATIIGNRLSKLAGFESQEKINITLSQLIKKEKWEKNEMLIVLLITAIICLLIWFAVK